LKFVQISNDVIEDSDTTKKQIEEEFGSRIAELVDLVTKYKDPKDQKWKEKYYKRLQNGSIEAQLIKFADRLSNVRDLPTCPDSAKVKRYTKETIDVFLPWAKTVFPKAYELLKKELPGSS